MSDYLLIQAARRNMLTRNIVACLFIALLEGALYILGVAANSVAESMCDILSMIGITVLVTAVLTISSLRSLRKNTARIEPADWARLDEDYRTGTVYRDWALGNVIIGNRYFFHIKGEELHFVPLSKITEVNRAGAYRKTLKTPLSRRYTTIVKSRDGKQFYLDIPDSERSQLRERVAVFDGQSAPLEGEQSGSHREFPAAAALSIPFACPGGTPAAAI